MLDPTTLQINQVREDRAKLIEEYVKTNDPELLDEIHYLEDREQLLLTKQIVEGIK